MDVIHIPMNLRLEHVGNTSILSEKLKKTLHSCSRNKLYIQAEKENFALILQISCTAIFASKVCADWSYEMVLNYGGCQYVNMARST